MGWICTKCGTENDFSRQFCMACRFEPDEIFLRKELKAANKEKAAALNVVKKKAAALTRDYQSLRRFLFCLNAMALAAVVVFFIASALSSGLFTSDSARQLFAGDVSGHSGIQAFLRHGSEYTQRLDASLIQLDKIGSNRFATLAADALPAAARDNASALSASLQQLNRRNATLARRINLMDLFPTSPAAFLQDLPQLFLKRFGLQ